MESGVYVLELALADFDASLLPAGSPAKGTPGFAAAVHQYVQQRWESFGGNARIFVAGEKIQIEWSPATSQDPLEIAISKLKGGDYNAGVLLLIALRQLRPHDFNVLYNLGMALSDFGRLPHAVECLSECIGLNPTNVNARVALAVALMRNNDDVSAVKHLREAVGIEPQNLWAQRNLGACLGKQGQHDEAIVHLREAVAINPSDPASIYMLAEALRATNKGGDADELYEKVIKLSPHSDLAKKAQQIRTARADQVYQQRGGGLRMDAVMYCLSAIQKFDKMTPADVQRIAFEIALLGRNGLDINDSTAKYRLRSMPGSFSGSQLLCYMYVGFKQIAPDQDIHFDVSKEYQIALSMFNKPKE